MANGLATSMARLAGTYKSQSGILLEMATAAQEGRFMDMLRASARWAKLETEARRQYREMEEGLSQLQPKDFQGGDKTVTKADLELLAAFGPTGEGQE